MTAIAGEALSVGCTLVVVQFSIARRSLGKPPFKCPDEAGRVFISDGVSDFLYAQVAVL